VGFGSKELQLENGSVSAFSARAKHQKSCSLLPNHTETLATQARDFARPEFRSHRSGTLATQTRLPVALGFVT